MIRCVPTLLVIATLTVPSWAQAQQQRAGNSVVPSTHSPGCAGLMCDSDDPRRVANVPPPPCQGLLCGISPYAMQPPLTASAAAQLQEERARAVAAAAAPAPEPATRQKRRKARAKTSKAKAVATRTPDPASAPAPASPQ